MAEQVTVDRDTLEQWTEDALTQGIPPAVYVYNVLSAALDDDSATGREKED